MLFRRKGWSCEDEAMGWIIPAVLGAAGAVMFVVPHHGVGSGGHGRTLAANALDLWTGEFSSSPLVLKLLVVGGLLGVFYPAAALAVARIAPPAWTRPILAAAGVAILVSAAWIFLVIALSHANFMTGHPFAEPTPMLIIIPAFTFACGVWLIAAAIWPSVGRATGATGG